MPWTMSSSPQSCRPALRLISTSAEIRYSASPIQHSSRSLDSSSWRKQVCEVRPNRSSILGRFPVFQQSADATTTMMASRLDADSSPSVTPNILRGLLTPARGGNKSVRFVRTDRPSWGDFRYPSNPLTLQRRRWLPAWTPSSHLQ